MHVPVGVGVEASSSRTVALSSQHHIVLANYSLARWSSTMCERQHVLCFGPITLRQGTHCGNGLVERRAALHCM